ncbi:MAG: hypothetical protein KDJ27_08670 [Gammaproteobacteria bacterium]|nr:hypothetical protein [Gammaproteobacteria bacterium]MCB1923805.1 hypothetical protein [Gammaproteobacteria bacterium]
MITHYDIASGEMIEPTESFADATAHSNQALTSLRLLTVAEAAATEAEAYRPAAALLQLSVESLIGN